jgi:hypothetical protein
VLGAWRAVVQCDESDFQRDRLRILLAVDGAEGRRVAQPVKVEMGEPFTSYAQIMESPPPEAFLTLPEPAAVALFKALARRFIGTSDVERLRRDLEAERRRVDALIAGLGRVGGVTG